MNYEILFDDITRTIRKDYAGAEDIKNPQEVQDFRNNLSQAYAHKKLDDVYFLRVMKQYLATLRDRNLTLSMADNDHYTAGTRGIEVRCYEKELYVTASQDDRIKVGDKIGKINARSPKWYLEHLVKNIFWSDVEERMDWNEFLDSSERIRVDRPDGTREFMDLKNFPGEISDAEITLTQADDNTVVFRIDSFLDDEKIASMVEENAEMLNNCDKLIIDLRRNAAGAFDAFYPLIPYVLDRPMMLSEFMGEQGLYTNYTKKNSKRRITQITPYLKSEDEEYRAMAQLLIDEAKEKSGNGYVFEKDEDMLKADHMIAPCGKAKVIILTDSYTEDTAELFALQAARMEKVTIAGRPSRGTIDYTNEIVVNYEGGYRFTYPMSRTRACQKGMHLKDAGVPVDEYIAWTPAEITEDVVLKKAMAL